MLWFDAKICLRRAHILHLNPACNSVEYKISSTPVLKEYFSGSKIQIGVARINKSLG